MKKLLFLLLLKLSIQSSSSSSKEEETESEEEDSDEEEVIDSSCTKSKPSLCPDGICYSDYSFCAVTQGCTSIENPLMCPGGFCTDSFENCIQKTYKCAIESYQLCVDGKCRKSCKHINTMGCTSESPFHCASGNCVQQEAQCMDYRCSIEQPYLCVDLSCVSKSFACILNATNYLFDDKEIPIKIDRTDTNKVSINIVEKYNQNHRILKLNFFNKDLMYNNFTQMYKKLISQDTDEIDIKIQFNSYPKDKTRQSKLQYPETDLILEKITSMIFSKQYSYLKAQEFLRSTVFQMELLDYEYNHFFFNDFPSIQLEFNKIYGYPNPNLSEVDEKNIIEEMNLPYSLNDPSNIYCLGIFDEDEEEWKCISRNIIGINENLIEYKIPFPGIYGVIYSPRLFAVDDEEECDFVCQYRKFVIIFFILILPVFYLLVQYLLFKYKKQLSNNKYNLQSLLKSKKQQKKQNKKNKKNLIKEQKQDEQNLLDKNLQDENFDVQGNIKTFVNPMALNQQTQNQENQDEENEKVKLKFKRDLIMQNKLKLLKKLKALETHKTSLNQEINKLKQLIVSSDLISDYSIKVLLIGNSGVGKSCMLMRFVDNTFTTNFFNTIGVDFKMKSIYLEGKSWDTAGQERFKTITCNYYHGANGIILVYDITDRESFNAVKMWMGEIKKFAQQDVKKIIVGNKKDLEEKRAVTEQEGKELASYYGVEFMETSAKDTINIEQSFTVLSKEIVEKLEKKMGEETVEIGNQKQRKKINKGCC